VPSLGGACICENVGARNYILRIGRPAAHAMSELTTADFIVLVQDISIVRYFSAAALTLVIYDYLLTLDDEIQLIWPSRLLVAKLVFFINRYLPFIAVGGLLYVVVITPPDAMSMCRSVFLIFGVILYMRAYAIWECKGSVAVLLVAAQTIFYGIGLYFSARFLKSVTIVPLLLFSTGCLISFDDRIDWAAFILLIGSEIIALLALLIKNFRTPKSTVMSIIVQDGVVYFVFILLASFANLIVLRVLSPTLCNLLLLIQGALHSIFCNRLIMHIRSATQFKSWQHPSTLPVI